ncbi:MAG: hypothetical protein D3908_01450, partial [Candidatus Electrothrix sp. AUS4]|nr:hypothetical protein [Candidatus Electrothrix sp. AUS4]
AGSTAKTVSIYMDTGEIQGKKPVLLFTASQIDEVLAEAKVQALPFVSEYFLGLCAWREQVLPVIALDRFFGLSSQRQDSEGRYVVVRAVDTRSTGDGSQGDAIQRILRCVLNVPDHIMSGEISAQQEAIRPEQAGLPALFVRGLFVGERELFILPDLVNIIHSNSLHNVKK